MAEVLHRIFNSFALAVMLLGAAVLLLSDSPVLPPHFMLVATVPLLVQLFARTPDAPVALRVLAMTTNWVAAVLAGSLAAVALTGIGDAVGLTPMLGSAAALYGWNAVSMAATWI